MIANLHSKLSAFACARPYSLSTRLNSAIRAKIFSSPAGSPAVRPPRVNGSRSWVWSSVDIAALPWPVGHRQRDRAGAGSLEPVYTGALLSLSGILSAHSRHGAARGGLWAQVTPPITGAAPGRRRFQAPRAWCANHGGHARREPKAAPERLRRRSYPGRPAALASPLAGLRFLVRRKRIRLRGLVRAVVCAARLVLRPRLAAKYPHDSHCPALVQARREMLESA